MTGQKKTVPFDWCTVFLLDYGFRHKCDLGAYSFLRDPLSVRGYPNECRVLQVRCIVKNFVVQLTARRHGS